ncbi:MAG: hypothetical protein FJY83_11680 [Candidatus Aminicenantes bacterium]|nr:hypothetical protein [Candidatus Aminicenantes bacterium]
MKEQEGFQDLSDSSGQRFQVAREDGKAAVVFLHGASVLGAVSRRPDSLPAAMAALEETRRTLEKDETAPVAAVRERKWRLGFSERGRFDSWDNVETLDEERRLGRAAAFLRTRLVLEADVGRGLGFEVGLNNELRWVIAPSGEKFQADEAIFDRLLVRWSSPAGAPLVLTLGRQGLFFGDGFLVAEGTPLDETRSDYFNALRLDWAPAAGRRLTLFAFHQTEKDAFLPVIRSRNRPLTEQPETGLGAVFGWKEERKEWEAAVIFKKAAAGSSLLPPSDILAFDGRAVLGLRRGISLSGEAAVQAGKKGGAGLFAWGASLRLDWEAEIAPLPPLRISAGGFALSGDDPASVRDEGWDPMFGRWPRWSESYIHTLALEYGGRTAWWSNLSCLYGEMDFLFKDRIGLRLAVRGLSAPRAGTDSWSMVSGEGRTRGILWSARVALRLSGNLRGHLLYENFRPGDYYLPSADGYSFLRFELLWLY